MTLMGQYLLIYSEKAIQRENWYISSVAFSFYLEKEVDCHLLPAREQVKYSDLEKYECISSLSPSKQMKYPISLIVKLCSYVCPVK